MPYIPTIAAPTPGVAPTARKHRRSRLPLAFGAAATILIVLIDLLQHRRPGTAADTLVLIRNVDSASTAENLSDLLPTINAAAEQAGVRARAHLVLVSAAGGDPVTDDDVDLTVAGPDGSGVESDTLTRNTSIEQRVEQLLTAPTLPPTGNGRNIDRLLRLAATYHPTRVFYVGFGLSTVGAADARIQMPSIGPDQAVVEIAGQLPTLAGAQLSVLFTSAAGAQAPLSIPSQQWRTGWWQSITSTTGAELDGPSQVSGSKVTPGAVDAPPISPLPDGTNWHHPGATVTSTAVRTAVTTSVRVSVSTAVSTSVSVATTTMTPTTQAPWTFTLVEAVFVKDKAIFVDPAATDQGLRSWVAGLTQYAAIHCIRAAHYGDSSGAEDVSQLRAQVMVDRLRTILGSSVSISGEGSWLPGSRGGWRRGATDGDVYCTVIPRGAF